MNRADSNWEGTQDDPAPTPWVTVDWSLSLDDDMQALYQQAANLISGFTGIPDDRTCYFAQYMNNIFNFAGMVNNVQSDGNGGYFVTVSVHGMIDQNQLDNDQTGSIPPSLFSFYSEIYYIDNTSNVNYSSFFIPADASDSDQVPFVSSP